MSNMPSDKPGIKGPGAVRRKAIITSGAAQEDLVRIEPLHPENALPLLIQPAVEGVDLITWATNNRELLEGFLLKHGGILFRNFLLNQLGDFEKFITSVSGGLLEYRERSSPRSQVSGNIYTSTDHPVD